MLKRGNISKFFQTQFLIWIGRRWLVISPLAAVFIIAVLLAFGWLLSKVL